MKKVRIVHIVHSFGTGGMEKGIATIIRNGSNQFEHVIVCLSKSGESQQLLLPGIQVYELYKTAGNSFRFIIKLSNLLKHLGPCIVHTRNWGGMDGIIAAKLAGNFSVIHGEHGWDVDDTNGLNKKRIFVRRFLSRCVHEYICVSKDMEKWLKKKVRVGKRVTQIYNGVDIQQIAPEHTNNKLRLSLGLADNEIIVGIVARLDRIKNHALLFQAFDNIKKDYPNTRLLVIGDGPEKKRLESLAGQKVLFLGNRADVPEILRILDIFVLSSLNEGISNTILEAMATGIPVVATNVGGNSELVEHGVTGLLVESNDLEGLTSALKVYLDNKNLRSLHGKMARVRAQNNFSVQAMVNDYEKIYKRISTPPQPTPTSSPV